MRNEAGWQHDVELKPVGPILGYFNGELWWYQASPDAPYEDFLGPSKYDWLVATNQLQG